VGPGASAGASQLGTGALCGARLEGVVDALPKLRWRWPAATEGWRSGRRPALAGDRLGRLVGASPGDPGAGGGLGHRW